MTSRFDHDQPTSNRVSVPRDHGTTFIEVLVAVVLLGTAGIAVLTAMSTATVGARVNDEVVRAQRQLAIAGDSLTDTDPISDHYRGCDTNTSSQIVTAYQGVVDAAVGTPNDITVNGVEFWDRAASSFGTTCQMSSGDRLQRVALSTNIDGSPRSLSIIVRPTAVPTAGVVPAPTPPPVSGGGGGVVPAPTPGL